METEYGPITFLPLKEVFEKLCDDNIVALDSIPDCLKGENKTGKVYKIVHNQQQNFLKGARFVHSKDDKVSKYFNQGYANQSIILFLNIFLKCMIRFYVECNVKAFMVAKDRVGGNSLY